MAAKKSAQFNYMLDSKAGVEYWITGYYSSEIGEAPTSIESKPYGSMLMSFLDMDITLVHKIRETLERFTQVDSAETYVKRWPDFKDDIWKMEAVTDELPVVFSDLETILNFYINEYMRDPAGRESLSKAEIDRMVRGAQIIREHCEKIIERHALLRAEVERGSFAKAVGGARKTVEQLGADSANLLFDCNLQGHCILMQKDGRDQIELCFDAGVDLAAFLTVCLSDILNGGMEIVQCQHCGKPFITGGRAIYCDRAVAGGGTCRTVGALSKYHKSLENNPLAGKYRRAYKKHYARMMKGVMDRADFNAWRDTAKARLSACLSGELPESELDKVLDAAE